MTKPFVPAFELGSAICQTINLPTDSTEGVQLEVEDRFPIIRIWLLQTGKIYELVWNPKDHDNFGEITEPSGFFISAAVVKLDLDAEQKAIIQMKDEEFIALVPEEHLLGFYEADKAYRIRLKQRRGDDFPDVIKPPYMRDVTPDRLRIS